MKQQKIHENLPQPDPDNNLGRGAAGDREERIRHRAYEIWEREGWQEGKADSYWHRAAEDLDREDAEIRREGSADEKPGIRPRAKA